MANNNSCPICFSGFTKELISLNNIPVFNNILHNSREQALKAHRGDFSLRFCEECGHLFNGTYQAELLKYSTNYENSLHFSPKFQDFAKQLANHLVENYNIRNKNILEVGCGKGDFLNMICEAGNNRGFGFDESYEPSGHELSFVTYFQEFYSKKHAHLPVDLLVCRHVLEHIESPHKFIAEINGITSNYNPVFYFEVPNGIYTLRDMGIWDLIYEHFSYFNPVSLATLFRNNGYYIQTVSELYNNQFLGIEFFKNKVSNKSSPGYLLEEINNLAQNFKKAYHEKIAYWNDNLEIFKKEGKTVVVWGGGSKGVTFLNVLPTQDLIFNIVDINPRKNGMFVSGSGQQFISPNDLVNKEPDIIILMNPIYKEEIKQTLKSLNLNPEILPA